jgi:hypothetical protein
MATASSEPTTLPKLKTRLIKDTVSAERAVLCRHVCSKWPSATLATQPRAQTCLVHAYLPPSDIKVSKAFLVEPRSCLSCCSHYTPLQEQETEYAVSPNTPLLSTEVQQNAWVCGKLQQPLNSPAAWAVMTVVAPFMTAGGIVGHRFRWLRAPVLCSCLLMSLLCCR